MRRTPVVIASACFAVVLSGVPALASGAVPGVPLPTLPGVPVPSAVPSAIPVPHPTLTGVPPIPVPLPTIPVPLPTLPVPLPTGILPPTATPKPAAQPPGAQPPAGSGSLGLPPPPYYTELSPYDIGQVDWEADRAKWLWNDPHARDVVVDDNAGNGHLLIAKQVPAFLAAQKRARLQAYAADHPQHGVPAGIVLVALALLSSAAVGVAQLRNRPTS